MAGSTGLEPAASGVTGRRSNQLNYDPDLTCRHGQRHTDGDKKLSISGNQLQMTSQTTR